MKNTINVIQAGIGSETSSLPSKPVDLAGLVDPQTKKCIISEIIKIWDWMTEICIAVYIGFWRECHVTKNIRK